MIIEIKNIKGFAACVEATDKEEGMIRYVQFTKVGVMYGTNAPIVVRCEDGFHAKLENDVFIKIPKLSKTQKNSVSVTLDTVLGMITFVSSKGITTLGRVSLPENPTNYPKLESFFNRKSVESVASVTFNVKLLQRISSIMGGKYLDGVILGFYGKYNPISVRFVDKDVEMVLLPMASL